MNEQFIVIVDAILATIDNVKTTSIRECLKTDLYYDSITDSITESINSWYEDLRKAVLEHPPDHPVKMITIFESSQSHISRIEYSYAKNVSKQITFKIVADDSG